jgi:hypothetical protein
MSATAASFRDKLSNKILGTAESSGGAASGGGGQGQPPAQSEASATSQQFNEMLDEVEARLRANPGAAWIFSKYPPPFASELVTPEMTSNMLADVIADFRASAFVLEEGRSIELHPGGGLS